MLKKLRVNHQVFAKIAGGCASCKTLLFEQYTVGNSGREVTLMLIDRENHETLTFTPQEIRKHLHGDK